MIGIDEVGRGSWAGPFVIAGVSLVKTIPGLDDSKKLTESKRRLLAKQIKQQAEAVELIWCSPQMVDEKDLTFCMQFACDAIFSSLSKLNQPIVIDGNINYLQQHRHTRAVVKAEGLYEAVAAASIVAKVARDAYMARYHHAYPQYGFADHVGYGTQKHTQALKENGPSRLHRYSYKPVKRAHEQWESGRRSSR